MRRQSLLHLTFRALSFTSYTASPRTSTSLFFASLKHLKPHPNPILTSRRMVTSEPPKVCAPCASLNEEALLSIELIQGQLADMPLWSLEETDGGYCISRRFTAQNFQAALEALNSFGAIAEREGHHPDLHLTNYREVTISLWTHKLGGLTQNDLTLAKVFDTEVEVVYSPKWLRENPGAKTTQNTK